MTVHRIQGSEIEYGIVVTGQPDANPVLASSRVVNAYASAQHLARRARWDFEEETPLCDARGFSVARQTAEPGMLTNEETSMANVILTNGARLYVDHAHPEYSSPEVTSPLDVVRWEKAGELLMARAANHASDIRARTPHSGDIVLYKNNVDNKGASYGAHENYLVQRGVPFRDLVAHLTPFFASRQIMCGAGRVGRLADGSEAAFQISQRADYIETEVALETTVRRPIINTRDEPHADATLFRRLHVIIGDANMCETSIFMKHATTSLMLHAIETKSAPAPLVLRDPVRAVHAISHDPTLRQTVELDDGRHMTALDIQWQLFEAMKAMVAVADAEADSQTQLALDRWEQLLTGLGRDPDSCFGQIDWVTKLHLLNRYRDRDSLAWADPTLQLIDLQYHDIRSDRGVFHKLAQTGRVESLIGPEAIEDAVTHPPTDTRAYFRGMCMNKFGHGVAAASWDSIIFDVPGRDSLLRIPTTDPHRGTREHVRRLFDDNDTIESFVAALTTA
ncbi:MAG: proteasome accessory factor PafA2 [Aeromicrobium sp.]|nr:MAG: proteasome accessory factor PafA2 [Aeromicrobium sp.]